MHKPKVSQRFLLLSTALLAWVSWTCESLAQSTELIRVMSFNIRYGTANDGINRWDLRKEFLVETIRNFDPDMLGTQETLASQRDYLAQALDGYGVVAAGRDDGRAAERGAGGDEHDGIGHGVARVRQRWCH